MRAQLPTLEGPAGGGTRRWIRDRPLGGFLVLAFGLSWIAFVAAALGLGGVGVIVGAFGPATAAAVVTRIQGQSIRVWFHGLLRWRLPARFYVYALGVPPALVAVTELELTVVHRQVAVGGVLHVLPEYLITLLLVALLGGGQEEPGWRGFALDRLQAAHSPLMATMVLGLLWGLWHLPVYGVGGLWGPVMLAPFYTWLYNRTESVLLCTILHASFNTAVGYLDMANHGLSVGVAFTATAVIAACVLVFVTRGRLGLPARPVAAEPAGR